jgi:NADH:ubiquinone oxidoreductase subunit 6 (subunit J)
MNDSLLREVTRVAIYTLAIMVLSMVAVMLYGLFDEKVDNAKIFEVFTPAFQMCIGSFVGFLGGIQVGKSNNESE